MPTKNIRALLVSAAFAALGAASAHAGPIGVKPPPPYGGPNPYATPCATGFKQVQVVTDSNGVQTSYSCDTGWIYCPPAPTGYVLTGPGDESGDWLNLKTRVRYKYLCQYNTPSGTPPPK